MALGKRKYRHTFCLVSGEEVVAVSDIGEPISASLGGERVFYAMDESGVRYMMPFFSVWYVRTEEVGEFGE